MGVEVIYDLNSNKQFKTHECNEWPWQCDGEYYHISLLGPSGYFTNKAGEPNPKGIMGYSEIKLEQPTRATEE